MAKNRLVSCGIMFSVLSALAAPRLTSRAKQLKPSEAFRNTVPGVAYVGSVACAPCHRDIYDRFLETDMGRSMSPAKTPAELEKVKFRVTVYDKDIGRYFDVFRDGDEIHQSEYALDARGRDLYRHTEKLAYAIGAGENGWTYVVERGNYLFQAPLSYYAKPHSWNLSPGHELGFNRAILTGCVVCHSGRAEPIPNRDALYRRPAFQQLAIGCENCHGPGELHAAQRTKGASLADADEAIDTSIVNPAKLPNWLADNTCMFCHQEGDARVLQPGKDYLDFRPGTPLHNTLAIFNVPLEAKPQEQSPLLNHYSLMIASRCFRASAGKLSCLTCHDPHLQPSAAEAPKYYRLKCLTCHAGANCTLPVAARLKSTPPDNCVGCHMPKKQLQFISHSALTDHRIARRPGEPFPDALLHQSTPGLPGLLYLDAEPGQPAAAAVPPMTLLLALRQLSDRGEPYRSRYLALLGQVAPGEPNNPVVLGMLAREAAQEETPEGARRAIGELGRAIDLGSTWPSDYDLLGVLLLRSGRSDELQRAAEIVGRGIALAPYTPSLYSLMAECNEMLGKHQDAIDILERGLGLFPEETSMRNRLKRIEDAVK